jgi:predicted nucleic acid-binding protein
VILADSTVWIDHVREANAVLCGLLLAERVLVHPFVVGEVALGHIRNRVDVLRELRRLPAAPVARDDEVAAFIECERLFGQGLSYIDIHLLAAVRLLPETQLWTRDKRLAAVAERLSIAARAS